MDRSRCRTERPVWPAASKFAEVGGGAEAAAKSRRVPGHGRGWSGEFATIWRLAFGWQDRRVLEVWIVISRLRLPERSASRAECLTSDRPAPRLGCKGNTSREIQCNRHGPKPVFLQVLWGTFSLAVKYGKHPCDQRFWLPAAVFWKKVVLEWSSRALPMAQRDRPSDLGLLCAGFALRIS